MMQIDRNSLGLNKITYHPNQEPSEAPLAKTVTVYGRGIIDKIALAFLHFLSIFSRKYQPIDFKVSYRKHDKYFFPQDMKITRQALKSLLNVDAAAWSKVKGIELTKHTRQNIVRHVSEKNILCSPDGVIFQKSLRELRKELDSEISNRIMGIQLYLSQKLSQLECDTCEITLPIEEATGKYVARGSPQRKHAYSAKVQIAFDDGQRVVKLLADSSKDPAFSQEAEYVLANALHTLNELVSEPYTMKRIAKELENHVFGQKFLDLGKQHIPVDPQKTMVRLDSNEDSPLLYPIANHIQLQDKDYIALAYPLYEEPWKFWEMLYEQKCPVFVKLNDIQKNSNPEHDQSYWPAPGEVWEPPEAPDLKVICTEETKIADDLIKREFEITKNGECHKAVHIDFLGWPDQDTPIPEKFQRMLQQVNLACESAQKSLQPKASPESSRKLGPIAVHCAAGIGRTGTFLGIHSTLDQAEPDFFKMLYDMRKQRSDRMVETPKQFQFIKHMHQRYHEDS